MLSENEMITINLDVVLKEGRKKVISDLHYGLDKVTCDEMILFYEQHDLNSNSSIINPQLVNYKSVGADFASMCIR